MGEGVKNGGGKLGQAYSVLTVPPKTPKNTAALEKVCPRKQQFFCCCFLIILANSDRKTLIGFSVLLFCSLLANTGQVTLKL